MGIAEDMYVKYVCVCEVCGVSARCRCSRCGANYCSRDCQRKAWPKHKKMCKMSHAQQVVHALSRLTPSEKDVRHGEKCWVCLDDSEAVYWGGCGCRNGGMCGHISCFVKAAEASCPPSAISSMDRFAFGKTLWKSCSLCGQEWMGTVSYELARALVQARPKDEYCLLFGESAIDTGMDFATGLRFARRRMERIRKPVLEDDTASMFEFVIYGNLLCSSSQNDGAVDVLRQCHTYFLREWKKGNVSLPHFMVSAEKYAEALLSAITFRVGRPTPSENKFISFASRAVDALKEGIHLPDSRQKVRILRRLAESHARLDRLDQATVIAKIPLEYCKKALGKDHEDTGRCLSILNSINICRNDLDALVGSHGTRIQRTNVALCVSLTVLSSRLSLQHARPKARPCSG